MKYFLHTIGSSGDIYPFIGLADQLSRNNKDVSIITHEVFREKIESRNIDFIPIDKPEDYTINLADFKTDPFISKLRARSFLFQNIHSHMLESILIFTRHIMLPAKNSFKILKEVAGPEDVVISHFLGFGARAAADINKFKTFIMVTAPYWLNFKRQSEFEMLLHPMLSEIRDECPVPEIKKIMSEWMYKNTEVFCLFPEWFNNRNNNKHEFRHTTFPTWPEETGFVMSKELQAILKDKEHPLVIVNLYSNESDASTIYKIISEICKETKLRCVIITKKVKEYQHLTAENLIFVEFLPLQKISRECSLLIHHGGIGTLATAMRSSVPSIGIPNTDEQSDNITNAGILGVCRMLERGELTVEILKTEILRLLAAEKSPNHEISQRLLADSNNQIIKSMGLI